MEAIERTVLPLLSDSYACNFCVFKPKKIIYPLHQIVSYEKIASVSVLGFKPHILLTGRMHTLNKEYLTEVYNFISVRDQLCAFLI